MLLKAVRGVYILTPRDGECFVKKELRTRLRGILASIGHAEVMEKSRLAAHRLFAEPEHGMNENGTPYTSAYSAGKPSKWICAPATSMLCDMGA